jgi:hypothetical protein
VRDNPGSVTFPSNACQDYSPTRRIPPVRKLCQNPIYLGCRKLRFERKQLPQVVDIRHFRMELMESLEPANILRNQQVAGSIPAGGSIKSILKNGFQ